MLDAFKIKPYDLEPIYATWTDGPIFKGDPKKDPPVEEWLERIKAGCVERKVPEECWYKVAQHFMGPKAKARLDELKAVIAKVHGGKYRWTWKKFKVAMQNMGWGIDSNQTETIKVSKQTGSWWTLRKKEEKDEPAVAADASQRPVPTRSETMFWGSRRGSLKDDEAPLPPLPTRSDSSFWGTKKVEEVEVAPQQRPRAPTRSGSDFWPKRRNSKDETEEPSTSKRPSPAKSISDTAVVTTAAGTPKPPMPSRSNTMDSGTVTTVTQAPVWLLNACTALEYITSEHPKAMSIISAILITAGSIPAIPAIGAGVGGAVLASGAAHAIGAIAVGLGQALSVSVKNQHEHQQQQQQQAPSTIQRA